MAIRVDPENNETSALFDLADFGGKRVLEIGCGDGRLTWRYAGRAAHVTAIDPFAEGITRAREDLPGELQGRVGFHPIAFLDFAAASKPSTFDIAILSWSLCCMSPEGMVPALEEIHRLLRADGSLIAIRPVSGASLIEAYRGGRVLFAEPVPVPAEDHKAISQAEDALAQVVQCGLFALERSTEFDFLEYGSSVAELRDFLARADAFHDSPKDEAVAAQEADLYARVEDTMQAAGEGTEVVLHDKARIARLRPMK